MTSDDVLARLLENPSSVQTIDDLPEALRADNILKRYPSDAHPLTILKSEANCQRQRYDPSKLQGYKQPTF